jgi:hypothetical protein
MPRRGEHQREFPPIGEPKAAVERIGLRVVSAPDRTGTMRAIVFDPSVFRCAVLAGELADEWVDYVDITNVTGSSAGLGRRAIRDFCTHVDSRLGEHAPGAGLAKQHPDLARVLAEWERTLPSRFRAGSPTPSTLAATVRALISRRAHHEQRPVAAGLRRLVDGEVGVSWGNTQEVDEFSRTDKHALVRAAWEWVNRLDTRLAAGWAAADRGKHPAEHGWTEVADLLWGLAHGQVYPHEILDNLPIVHHWPPELRACIERCGRPIAAARAKEMLTRWLVQQLYPSHLDLHAYRILLVAATGHAPEEVTTLTIDDVEFLPSGVGLTLTKRRAQRVRHRSFAAAPADPVSSQPVDFTDRPHREVAAIIRRLMQATDRIRGRTPNLEHLFVAASVSVDGELRLAVGITTFRGHAWVTGWPPRTWWSTGHPTSVDCASPRKWRRRSPSAAASPTPPTTTTRKCSGATTRKAPPCA